MKKKIIAILVVLILSLTTFKIKASTTDFTVEIITKTSIRIKEENTASGLRFYARLNQTNNISENGFYLIYGKADIDTLKNTLETASESDIIINDKPVYKASVNGFTSNGEFSVVLIGIPEQGYLDNITVIAYSVIADEIHFSEAFTRSLAETALLLANTGYFNEVVDDILTVINNKKRLSVNIYNQFRLTSSLFEDNPIYLKNRFIDEWNNYFDESIQNLEEDINNSDLKTFFLDKENWSWIINYFKNYDELISLNEIETFKQTLISFFKQSFEQNSLIDFTEQIKYEDVKIFNDQIYINSVNYNFYNIGEVINLPQSLYTEVVDSYLINGSIYNVGDNYLIIEDDVLFTNIINHIYFTYSATGDFHNYKLISFSDGIFIEDYVDAYIYFTITTKPGFIFSDDIQITPQFQNGKTPKEEKRVITPTKINYWLDDPNWSPNV